MPSIFKCLSVWAHERCPNVQIKVYGSVDNKYGVVVVCGGTPAERLEAMPVVRDALDKGGVSGVPILDQDDPKIDKIQFN